MLDMEVEAGHHYPEHDLDYPNDVWMGDGGGVSLKIPKTVAANMKRRKAVLKQAQDNPDLQQAFRAACAKNPLIFLNLFCWTYRPKYTCSDGVERAAGTKWTDEEGKPRQVPGADAPVITWPAQDVFVEEFHIGVQQGGTLLLDKSREQGATVISMYMILWAWLFIPRFACLVISRKKDMVDSHTEDSLFGKLDYLISKLPEWMIADGDFSRMRGNLPSLINIATGSRVIGETSNKDVGQSMRTTMVFVDEAARFPDGKALMKSITSVASFYLLASTPDGPGTEFSKLREHAATPEGRKRITVVTLGYWDHPEMGRGRCLVCDEDGHVTGKKGSYYWDTPAFRVRKEGGATPKDLRENWLIDHDTSGLLVLDSNVLTMMRKATYPPMSIGVVETDSNQFYQDPDGDLFIYIELDKYGNPPADDNYVIGGDIAQGVERSNSVLAITSRRTGRMIAEYVSASISPQDLALVAIALGQWAGGDRGYAFIIWERNGPGISFGHEIVNAKYPFLYYQRTESRRIAKRTRSWGWQSTGDSKEIMFKELNKAMKHGKFATPSFEGVSDMGGWVWDANGRAVCGHLRDESTGAQERHGDRAIAYAMCVLGAKEVAEYEGGVELYKPGTIGHTAGHNRIFAQKTTEVVDPFGYGGR